MRKGMHGFKSFGHFASIVRDAEQSSRARQQILNAATLYGSEGIGADGGYAVPPDFKEQIVQKVLADSLLSRTDLRTTKSNGFSLPIDETEPWNRAIGPAAVWMAEGTPSAQTKPSLGAVNIRLEKLLALVPVTSDLFEDDMLLEQHLLSIVAPKFDFSFSDVFLNGDGVGKPAGILQSKALITMAPEGGQPTNSVVFKNISNMRAAMPPRHRRNAVWLANADLETQLEALQVPGTASGATMAYLPAGTGVNGSDLDTLMGRPVIYTEAAAPAGKLGDLVLVDPTQYLAGVKSDNVIRTDMSMHMYFDQHLHAYRFIMRVGGQPWWSKPVTPKNSTGQKSAYVVLGARP